MPEVFSLVWKDFRSLDSARTSNGYGANPIGYSEVYAYCVVNQIELQPWEIEVLKIFDVTLLNLQAEQQRKETNKK